MCKKCHQKVHPKFKLAKEHKIIDIKDISLNQEEEIPKVDFKPVKCSVHKTQTICLYCITCSQSVCPVCIANEHQKHDFQEMEKLYSEKYTTIKEINDSIENETLVRFDEQLNKIEVTRESDNRHFMKIKSEIQQKEKILTAAFRSYFLELLAKLEENRKDNEIHFNLREGELKSSKRDLLNHKATLDELLNSNDTSRILTTDEGVIIDKLLSFETSIKPPNATVTNFIASNIHLDISKLVGSLVSVSVVSSYLVPSKITISSLTVQGDNTLWFYDGDYIWHIDPQQGMSVISKFDITAIEIAADNLGNIYFTVASQLKMLSTEGDVKLLYEFAPRKLSTVHVSRGHVVVGVIGREGKKGSHRLAAKLVVLDLRGRLQAEYVEDKNNSPLFAYNCPRCVVSTKSGSLCYIDCTSINDSYNGRVVMFSDNKFIQWTYEGNSAINKDNRFAPVEVLVTKSENTIVSDNLTNTLHILSNQGAIFTVIDLSRIGIGKPGVMDIADKDYLWVSVQGQWIYCLKLFGV
jgi:hypothetical protein